MRIVQQLLIKIMNLHEEFDFRNYELRSIWHFYKCYNLAIVILGKEDPNIRHKNHLWKRIVESQIEGEINVKAYTQLKNLMRNDFAVISEAIKEISRENEELGYDEGDLWTPNALAVQFMEVED